VGGSGDVEEEEEVVILEEVDEEGAEPEVVMDSRGVKSIKAGVDDVVDDVDDDGYGIDEGSGSDSGD
jgi:hypothetical protein